MEVQSELEALKQLKILLIPTQVHSRYLEGTAAQEPEVLLEKLLNLIPLMR
jgi:hypothetical protein